MTTDPAPLEPQDVLDDLAADMVSLTDHQACVAAVFAHPEGTWQPLRAACPHIPAGEDAEVAHVTWLPYPPSTNGPDYATIIFYSEPLHWHAVALYNRATLDR